MKKTATKPLSDVDRVYVRHAEAAVTALLGGKWSVAVLCSMRSGPVRIGQLSRIIPGASKKVLSQALRRLESEGVVVRADMTDIVLHVEYSLRPEVRESVLSLLDTLSQWGITHSSFTPSGVDRSGPR